MVWSGIGDLRLNMGFVWTRGTGVFSRMRLGLVTSKERVRLSGSLSLLGSEALLLALLKATLMVALPMKHNISVLTDNVIVGMQVGLQLVINARN